jgi:hypothetical protein
VETSVGAVLPRREHQWEKGHPQHSSILRVDCPSMRRKSGRSFRIDKVLAYQDRVDWLYKHWEALSGLRGSIVIRSPQYLKII